MPVCAELLGGVALSLPRLLSNPECAGNVSYSVSMVTSERVSGNDGRSMRHAVTLGAILCCTVALHHQIVK